MNQMAKRDMIINHITPQIKCVEREITLRKRVYPKLIASWKMKAAEAEKRSRSWKKSLYR